MDEEKGTEWKGRKGERGMDRIVTLRREARKWRGQGSKGKRQGGKGKEKGNPRERGKNPSLRSSSFAMVLVNNIQMKYENIMENIPEMNDFNVLNNMIF